jgi:hypothetical protein
MPPKASSCFGMILDEGGGEHHGQVVVGGGKEFILYSREYKLESMVVLSLYGKDAKILAPVYFE